MANFNAFKVKLQSTVLDPTVTPVWKPYVVFDTTPDIIETRSVNYKTVDPMHMPGSIYVYANSTSRTYNVTNIKLISRTPQEAMKNIMRLHILRSWTVSNFGKGDGLSPDESARKNIFDQNQKYNDTLREIFKNQTTKQAIDSQTSTSGDVLGSPPRILLFSAYSDSSQMGRTPMHVTKVPVIIQQLSIPYPSDVDYINATNGVPMPTIMTIDLTLTETHSPNEYKTFDLDKYRKGLLPNF